MKHNSFTFLLFFVFLYGCNRLNANPERLDPIYNSIEKKLSNAKKDLDDEKKALDDYRSSLDAVKPQTGQIKYAEKRVVESQARIERLVQNIKYQELRLSSRKALDNHNYLKSRQSNVAWPDPKEYEEYLATERLVNESRSPHSPETKKAPEKGSAAPSVGGGE